MSKFNDNLSPAELHARFTYIPETGHLLHKRTSGNGRIGNIVGSKQKNGTQFYFVTRLKGKGYFVHRIVWAMQYGQWPHQIVDHINGNGLDNRLDNLRLASHSLNAHNSHRLRKSKSGLTGVTQYGSRWIASIRLNKRSTHLGIFATKELASDTYQEAKAAQLERERFTSHLGSVQSVL